MMPRSETHRADERRGPMLTLIRRAGGALHGIRRDDALRRLPLWISASAGVALLLAGVGAYRACGEPAVAPVTLTVVLWCVLVPYLAQ